MGSFKVMAFGRRVPPGTEIRGLGRSELHRTSPD